MCNISLGELSKTVREIFSRYEKYPVLSKEQEEERSALLQAAKEKYLPPGYFEDLVKFEEEFEDSLYTLKNVILCKEPNPWKRINRILDEDL